MFQKRPQFYGFVSFANPRQRNRILSGPKDIMVDIM